jgi:TonB family protein
VASRYSFVRFLRRFSQTPKQPSLFHYARDKTFEKPFVWKEFLGDLAASFRSPAFIPSVFGDVGGAVVDQNQLRTRRMESAFFSVVLHGSIILLSLLLVQKANRPIPAMGTTVIINTPFFDLPDALEGNAGGGGGGGGKREQTLPAWGRMPAAARLQLLVPDPQDPAPLVPADESVTASVVMPIDIPQDQNLPIGDLTAPPSSSRGSGPGTGNGTGTGDGAGFGPGKGPGYGPGENGGTGGGREGTIGNGVYGMGVPGLVYPEVLLDPKPEYTEGARKSHTEGIILIQAIVRRDGSADRIRVIRGLGHGLDESAIQAIGAKWRFRPGRLNGVPVDVLANIEISFRLF